MISLTQKINILISHITILFLISIVLPIGLFLPTTILNQLNNSSICSEDIRFIPITKLMKESNYPSSSLSEIFHDDDLKTIKPPSFVIGNQVGNGGGVYQIRDSLIKINSSSLKIQNTLTNGNPDGHNTAFTINDSLENFLKNSADFQIQNVTAKEDWRQIESNTTDTDLRDSKIYIEIAQKFEIMEDYANITMVEVYLTYYDKFSGDKKIPHGTLSIFDDVSGEPNTSLGMTSLEEGLESVDIGPIPPAWVTYTFPQPINVTKGSYWLVFNDTGDQTFGYWEWFTQDDTTNGDAGITAMKLDHGDSWAVGDPYPDGDITSAIRVLHTDASWDNYVYSSPNEILMTYNTSKGDYELSSFTFKADDTPTHKFYSNTSVSFTSHYMANYTFTSVITTTVTYQAQNGSDSFWNLSFSTIRVKTPDIIRNRSITINGIQTDWNGSKIYWNNSSIPEYTTLVDNPNVTWDGDPTHGYTYGNTTMVINASTLSSNVTWLVCFNATNYISNFNLEQNSVPLSFPLRANVTDTLDLIYTVGEPDGNASYWIEYNPTGSQITAKTNVSYSDNTVNDTWDINHTLDQTTNINGTYDLQVFWISMDKTKVGTYTLTLDLFVNTSLNIQTESEVVIGELFNITAFYKSIHNKTDVKNAKIWCDASWSSATDVYMNQISIDYSYNATFSTSNQTPGTVGTITITTRVGWFVNWTRVINVKFVYNSSLTLNPATDVLEWYENTTIRIDYLNSTGDPILDAAIQVNGTNAEYNDIIAAYIYTLNTTDYSGVGSYVNIPIFATHAKHLSRQINYSFIITPGITDISGTYNGKSYLNNTNINIPYAKSSADSLVFNLKYYHILTNDNLLTSEPEIESLIPHISSELEADSSWTVILDPDQTGTFVINVTFSLINYYNALFMINVNVQDAQTKIQTDFMNSTEIYYTEHFEFSVFLLNADWNENITFTDYGSIEISDEIKLQYLERIGDNYWFRFKATQLSIGQHSVQISFSHPYFETSVITVVFNVVEMPTLTIPPSNVHSTNNGSIMVEDSLRITIDNYQTYKETSISSLDEIFLWLNGTSVPESYLLDLELSQAPFSFNLSTIGWQYGVYNLTLQIYTIGFQAQYFSFNITLLGWPTSIIVEIEPGKNIHQGEDIIFITTLVYSGESSGGVGAGITPQTSLNGVEITYYIVLKYENGSTRVFEEVVQIDESGKARYTIEGDNTIDSVGFTNITIQSSSGTSGLSSIYSMSDSELASYEIIPPAIDIFGVIVTVLLIVTVFLVTAITTGTTIRIFLRRRKVHKELILNNDKTIEQSFEDIKSIRLILARHESGLQFYVEKTISEFQTDTDALSGMSAAISQFIEDVSGSMRSTNENGSPKEKFETINREGFHMLVWNGKYSSLIIISELQLPDYFKERLDGLGNELEETFEDDLRDFFDVDKFPQSIIKKMVRKYISLHYFSAFVLNEGVLTLKDIKLSKRDKKMLKQVKKVSFEKQGVRYFFSEQIISYLANKFKRSEAITFLERMIKLNLLVECSQEELYQLI
ncbi:MAG: hypothetical protein ACFFB5_24465 [Promethearchaeota archaeon]